jgi:hypothetical protein
LVKRGLQTPVTITTDGAVGLTKASDALWPQAWRIRWQCRETGLCGVDPRERALGQEVLEWV